MSVREWLNQNPAVTTIITIVVLGAALVALALALRDRGMNYATPHYFFDLKAGRLTASAADNWPGATPADSNLAYAYVYACGPCGNYDGMTPEQVNAAGGFIGYLETWTDEARTVIARGVANARDEQIVNQGRLLRQINDQDWHPADEYEQVVMRALSKRCSSGASPTRCQPEN